jgi:hypothetical protein
MDRESLQAQIHHEVAELQAHFPQIAACRATLDEWQDEDRVSRYCLRLDIRWPQRQLLISGEPKNSAPGALRAALDAARRQLRRALPERH